MPVSATEQRAASVTPPSESLAAAASQAIDGPNVSIFVGNLPPGTSAMTLHQWLTRTFQAQLPVDCVTVGGQKPYGFVNCSASAAETIMSQVKSHSELCQFGSSTLRIEIQTGPTHGRKTKEQGISAPIGARTADAAPRAATARAVEPFRMATYFGAFDPVHENHVRQALAACDAFHIDACFLCPNADQGNKNKSIGVPLADRLEMLRRRCSGHNILRPYNCGGRAWNWEGRGVVTQEIADTLVPTAGNRGIELYQIIGQDSYEKAVVRSPRILEELRDPPRFLIVTPREGCSSADIRVPSAYRDRVFPLSGYRDEMLLSSTIIRAELSQGRHPDPRALHPSVLEFIQQRGIYGYRPISSSGSSFSDSGVPALPPQPASSTAASKPAWVHTAVKHDASRGNHWGAAAKTAPAAGGGHSPKAHGGSPKAATLARDPRVVAAEINQSLTHSPPTRHCHIVVLFGAHGTGKGTVAQALCSRQGYQHVSFGDIKRGIVAASSEKLSFEQLGPAVFRQYQERVAQLFKQGALRIVVDGLDPQYWRGQAHGTLGAVDACVLLSASEADCDALVKRVIERGREPASDAAWRVRRSIPDTERCWAVVGNLAQELRGLLAEVDSMQARDAVICKVEETLKKFW